MSTKTEHLGLHQWEPEDSFLRTDFNEDFAKIDAGVKAAKQQISQVRGENCMIRLASILTTQDMPQIDLDVSGFDWDRFAEVRIYVNLLGSHNMNAYLRANGIGAGSDYSQNGTDSVQSMGYIPISYPGGNLWGSGIVTLPRVGEKVVAYTRMFTISYNSNFNCGCCKTVNKKDLKTLNFVPDRSDARFLAGSAIHVYGVLL